MHVLKGKVIRNMDQIFQSLLLLGVIIWGFVRFRQNKVGFSMKYISLCILFGIALILAGSIIVYLSFGKELLKDVLLLKEYSILGKSIFVGYFFLFTGVLLFLFRSIRLEDESEVAKLNDNDS